MSSRRQSLVRVLLVCLLAAAIAASAPSSSGAASAGPQVLAQFGIGNLITTGKDLAVKQALAAFGKAIGAQLPMVVAASDAYPTVPKLPGAPFAATTAPNVAGPLRASTDGTVALPPGDYSFPVSVFCMRATAGSPSAHRYLVAPLHGSAADIITALNSRIPSYAVDHHVLQVLSWDILAGLPYGAMGRDQRAAVDSIVPEYRGRLSGDIYQQMRDGYARTAGNVPGMPSFEGALQALGPVGATVVKMQNIRQQLAQPPPTFEQLARSLVPELAPVTVTANVANPAGDTPWSRYSDRVFVRFVTTGNYATPGTYQVRVLPPSPQARAGSTFARFASFSADRAAYNVAVVAAAPVPFGNTVNNPGTDAVQPLTQTPLVPAPAPPPARPAPPPSPSIISETVATMPVDRSRTTVGVGESVKLTFTSGPAEWTLAGGGDGRLDRTSGASVTYFASEKNASETITAHGHNTVASITFAVIQPTGVTQKVWAGEPLIHDQGTPDIGFKSLSYLTPENVSFQFIEVKEDDVCAAITGGTFPPSGHHPGDKWSAVLPPVLGLGSNLAFTDTNYSGSRSTAELSPYRKGDGFVPSIKTWRIPWRYRVVGKTDEIAFTTVVATFTLGPDGVSLYASKAGATASTQVGYPSAGPEGTPVVPGAPDPCIDVHR
ncbi:MAG TPA: hypothetical protein VIK27_06275 [Candidatus Aquilonibacter sp.]